jgi:hypothetical protein
MNALYLLLNRRNVTAHPAPDGPPINDEPLIEIRPGAFARWIAEIESTGRLEKVDAPSARHQTATTEGIAAAHPGGMLEPG